MNLNIFCELTSDLTVDFTINPDFGQVEADPSAIALDGFQIFFEERRPFFIEGKNITDFQITQGGHPWAMDNLFYSRRIGDMDWGGKIIGKAGKYQFNGLFAKTNENEMEGKPQAMHNAIRVKRDILQSSVIGMTYADKITDTAYYRSLSLDYILNIGKTWKFTGQFVGSAPDDFASHSAWFVRFARENNIYHYHIRYSSIGKNFQDNVNQTGFIPDDDRHEFDSDIIYKWWLNKKVSYLNFAAKNNVFWSQDGVLRSWYLTYIGRMYSKNT